MAIIILRTISYQISMNSDGSSLNQNSFSPPSTSLQTPGLNSESERRSGQYDNPMQHRVRGSLISRECGAITAAPDARLPVSPSHMCSPPVSNGIYRSEGQMKNEQGHSMQGNISPHRSHIENHPNSLNCQPTNVYNNGQQINNTMVSNPTQMIMGKSTNGPNETTNEYNTPLQTNRSLYQGGHRHTVSPSQGYATPSSATALTTNTSPNCQATVTNQNNQDGLAHKNTYVPSTAHGNGQTVPSLSYQQQTQIHPSNYTSTHQMHSGGMQPFNSSHHHGNPTQRQYPSPVYSNQQPVGHVHHHQQPSNAPHQHRPSIANHNGNTMNVQSFNQNLQPHNATALSSMSGNNNNNGNTQFQINAPMGPMTSNTPTSQLNIQQPLQPNISNGSFFSPGNPSSPPPAPITPISNALHSGSRGQQATSFVRKLFEMVMSEDPTILHFQPDGGSFEVKDPRRLETEVLPRYYRHARFQSFVRQLNFYNFKKISKERNTWVYKHECFHRDHPDLLDKLRRKTSLHGELAALHQQEVEEISKQHALREEMKQRQAQQQQFQQHQQPLHQHYVPPNQNRAPYYMPQQSLHSNHHRNTGNNQTFVYGTTAQYQSRPQSGGVPLNIETQHAGNPMHLSNNPLPNTNGAIERGGQMTQSNNFEGSKNVSNPQCSMTVTKTTNVSSLTNVSTTSSNTQDVSATLTGTPVVSIMPENYSLTDQQGKQQALSSNDSTLTNPSRPPLNSGISTPFSALVLAAEISDSSEEKRAQNSHDISQNNVVKVQTTPTYNNSQESTKSALWNQSNYGRERFLNEVIKKERFSYPSSSPSPPPTWTPSSHPVRKDIQLEAGITEHALSMNQRDATDHACTVLPSNQEAKSSLQVGPPLTHVDLSKTNNSLMEQNMLSDQAFPKTSVSLKRKSSYEEVNEKIYENANEKQEGSSNDSSSGDTETTSETNSGNEMDKDSEKISLECKSLKRVKYSETKDLDERDLSKLSHENTHIINSSALKGEEKICFCSQSGNEEAKTI